MATFKNEAKSWNGNDVVTFQIAVQRSRKRDEDADGTTSMSWCLVSTSWSSENNNAVVQLYRVMYLHIEHIRLARLSEQRERVFIWIIEYSIGCWPIGCRWASWAWAAIKPGSLSLKFGRPSCHAIRDGKTGWLYEWRPYWPVIP